MGNLQAGKNEQERAKNSYSEALLIRRELAKDNPQTYLPDVADALNNLGILHACRNEQERAEKSFSEALHIRRKLAKDNPQTYLPKVAVIAVNMSIFYQNSKPNKRLSMAYADETIKASIQLLHVPIVRQYYQAALQVLQKWGVKDVDSYVKGLVEKLADGSN